jgi:hypothetical protein
MSDGIVAEVLEALEGLDEEKMAEALVRITPMINEVDPRFNPEGLQLLITAAETGLIKWSQAVNILSGALELSFAAEGRDLAAEADGLMEKHAPVIDPDKYGLAM